MIDKSQLIFSINNTLGNSKSSKTIHAFNLRVPEHRSPPSIMLYKRLNVSKIFNRH